MKIRLTIQFLEWILILFTSKSLDIKNLILAISFAQQLGHQFSTTSKLFDQSTASKNATITSFTIWANSKYPMEFKQTLRAILSWPFFFFSQISLANEFDCYAGQTSATIILKLKFTDVIVIKVNSRTKFILNPQKQSLENIVNTNYSNSSFSFVM